MFNELARVQLYLYLLNYLHVYLIPYDGDYDDAGGGDVRGTTMNIGAVVELAAVIVMVCWSATATDMTMSSINRVATVMLRIVAMARKVEFKAMALAGMMMVLDIPCVISKI